jgi:hypothetical protein
VPTKKIALKVYLSPEEQRIVEANSAKTQLSMSTYAKRIILGYGVKNVVDQQAVLELVRLKADMGRLGGLLKNALKEKQIGHSKRMDSFLEELESLKNSIGLKIRELGPKQ